VVLMYNPLRNIPRESSLVYLKFSVRTFDVAPDILTNVLRGLTQTLRPNAAIVPEVVHDRFLPDPFQLIILKSS
jgi:hypothetical protein